MPDVLIPLAQGCEELEAVTCIDLLRRAGILVTTVGLEPEVVPVVASRGTRLLPDIALDKVLERDFDLILLPGGLPGADHLNADPRLKTMIQRQAARGGYLAAICAAPKVLASARVLDGRRATGYPGAIDTESMPWVHWSDEAVVVDGRILTSRGPGTAMDFALQVIAELSGESARNQVEAGLKR